MNFFEGSLSVLNDARYYLQRIEAEDYCRPISLMSDSTIGQHTRHFIEFYQCLLTQADQRRINYCKRSRDLSIETSPQAALLAIDTVITDLPKLDLATPVILATSENEQTAHSTIGRELFYNIEHSIHHLALIKIGLKILLPQLELPTHFGLAPSTIKHRKIALQQS